MLAYLDFNDIFEIYTDASNRQLSTVITPKGHPIAFFSRKLEFLSIVECLKELKGACYWDRELKLSQIIKLNSRYPRTAFGTRFLLANSPRRLLP